MLESLQTKQEMQYIRQMPLTRLPTVGMLKFWTKLDGTAKGGIVVAISAGLGVPVKLVGVGEGIDDLMDFDRFEFLEALLPPLWRRWNHYDKTR